MNRGLTLVEVLVVLGLFCACALFAAPNFSRWYQDASCRQAAREIVSALRFARSQAISKTREVEVDFDLDANRYRMWVGNMPYGSSLWDELQPWSSLPQGVVLGVTKSCGKVGDGDVSTPHIDTIQFNPNGTCGASGSMMGYYLCVMTPEMKPRFAGAVLSTTTGRAIVRTWDAERGEWQR